MPDSSEKPAGASPTQSPSERPVPGSPSLSDDKELSKRNKESSPVGGKKTSIFSSIGNKFTKSKPKPVPSGTLTVPTVDITTSASVEDGFILVQHGSNVESNSGKPERDYINARTSRGEKNSYGNEVGNRANSKFV